MQKWEYCAIQGMKRSPFWPGFVEFTDRGCIEVTNFRSRPKGVSEVDAVAKLIAQLGEDGWEMVGCGITQETGVHTIYFKRPKP